MNLHNFVRDLGEDPKFRVRRFRDVNPASRRIKFRKLFMPNPSMRQLHARFLRYLLTVMPDNPQSFGVRRGTSRLQALEPHRKNRFFYVLDIQDAFPSVDLGKLADILCYRDNGLTLAEVREFLHQYCRGYKGGLPTGAPTSNHLFDLYLSHLVDPELLPLCQVHDLTYTRYVDDLIFSSNMPIGRRKRRALRQVVLDCGLSDSPQKSAVYDLTKGPVVILGISLSYGGRIGLPGHYLRHLQALLRATDKGADIAPALISGKMGSFLEVSRMATTLSERRVLNHYQILRRRWRRERRKAKGEPKTQNSFYTPAHLRARRVQRTPWTRFFLPVNEDDIPF